MRKIPQKEAKKGDNLKTWVKSLRFATKYLHNICSLVSCEGILEVNAVR